MTPTEMHAYIAARGKSVMIVPHIIPVECDIVPGNAEITYQMEIPLNEVPDGFLLTGVHSRYEIQHLRVRKHHDVHYSAPGWFVYAYHDHKLEPALFFRPKEQGWILDITHKRKYLDHASFNPDKLEFALIGQKVVPL